MTALKIDAVANSSVPFDMIMTLAVAAKMKIKTSLTDIPYAISDHKLLEELGYNLYDTQGKLNRNFMQEGTLRNLVSKYKHEELFNAYNNTVKNHIMSKMKIPDLANLHILDCTDIKVNF